MQDLQTGTIEEKVSALHVLAELPFTSSAIISGVEKSIVNSNKEVQNLARLVLRQLQSKATQDDLQSQQLEMDDKTLKSLFEK